jgi:hypothetical protein
MHKRDLVLFEGKFVNPQVEKVNIA